MPGPSGRGRGWGRYLFGAIFALALVWLLLRQFPGSLDTTGDGPRLVYLLALLALLGGGLFARLARRPGVALQHAAIWVGIGLVLLLGYSYRVELSGMAHRLSGNLVPATGQTIDGQQMRFTAEADGQFHVEAQVGGNTVRFLVDTGASEVMLSPADARRLGYDPATLAYTKVYQTANGTVRGAPVTIPEIVVGPIRLTDVAASINEHDTDGSLLGMSFLGRLSGYQVSGDTLTLSQ
jgi:aspartyl protease family protein